MSKKPADTLEEFEQEIEQPKKEAKVEVKKALDYTHHTYGIAKIVKENGDHRWVVLKCEVDIVNLEAKKPEIVFEEIHRDLITERFRILVSQNVL